MAYWPMATLWRQLHTALVTIAGLLISSTTVVTATDAPISEEKQVSSEQQIAAYQMFHAVPTISSFQTQDSIHEREVGERITEARRILMELQTYIEDTARAVELDQLLKIRKTEKDRLKDLLSSSLAAKEAFESRTHLTEDTLSTLTKTIVRNWLQSIHLGYQSAEAERELIESEKLRSDIEIQVTAIRRTLIIRRAELRALRAESAILSDELNRMRRQLVRVNAEARRFKKQQGHITTATEILRRSVTSNLRKILLEIEH